MLRLLTRRAASSFNFKYTSLSQNLLNKSPCFCTNNKETKKETKLGSLGSKYEVFKEEKVDVVLDVYEERLKKYDILQHEEANYEDPLEGLNLERGINGVFEIEDLVNVLKRENAMNIFVAEVPKDIQYVDYICIVSGKSQRHMQAIAQFVRRVYKRKRNKNDLIPQVEGENSKDWLALDLGNIALHIFSAEAREVYDLESLWSVGPQYDAEYNKKDPVVEALEKHTIYLKDLQPAS